MSVTDDPSPKLALAEGHAGPQVMPAGAEVTVPKPVLSPDLVTVSTRSTAEMVSVSDAELFAGKGSITVAGAVTVATFVVEIATPLVTEAVKAYVTLEPASRLTVLSLMLPAPDAAQLAPEPAVQVHVGVSSSAGMTSATVAPVTLAGPRLVTVME